MERRVGTYLQEGVITTTGKSTYVEFFLTNTQNSLASAQALLTHTKLKEFNGSLWVINASYYAMFYSVRALLEHEGILLKSEGSIHALTVDALIHFFYQSKKLEKKLCEVFAQAQDEASELLGKQTAQDLVQDYLWEKKKRAQFTYELGELAMYTKAQTSFERAKKFTAEIRALIHSKNPF